MVGLCWVWFVRLAERGKDGSKFPGHLASFAARHVHSGRKVCGQDKANDADHPGGASHHHQAVGTSLPHPLGCVATALLKA